MGVGTHPVFKELLMEGVVTVLLPSPLFTFYTTSLKNYRNERIIIVHPLDIPSALCENITPYDFW
jgi:hypothetical protein